MLSGFRPSRCWFMQFHADGERMTVNRLAVSNACVRIQIPLDGSHGKVLVGLPRVFGQNTSAVGTDVVGIGVFVRDVVKAAEFDEHLRGGADFRTS